MSKFDLYMASNSIINTPNGIYKFLPTDLQYGRKPIDKAVAKSNLFEATDILESYCVRYGIIYGTLLGAVRDGDFIEWDEDIDLYVLGEDRSQLLAALFSLRESKFEVVRYEQDLLTIIRDNEYIDFYIFNSRFGFSRHASGQKINKRYFIMPEHILFLGRSFPALHDSERFLRLAYGKDWKTPQRNMPGDTTSLLRKVKNLVTPWLPQKFVSFIKSFLIK